MAGQAHELKSWPKYFKEIVSGKKTFDVRVNDRGFAVGDQLTFREWDEKTKEYTGKFLRAKITYMMQGDPFLPEETCVMSIVRI